MKVIATEKLPIKMWLDEVEDGALEQAKNLANLPFAFKHVAIMPDCHQGNELTVIEDSELAKLRADAEKWRVLEKKYPNFCKRFDVTIDALEGEGVKG